MNRGAAGSGRADDNPESLKKRFNVYLDSTLPIIEYYEKKGLVRRVDSTRTPEEVREFEMKEKVFQNCHRTIYRFRVVYTYVTARREEGVDAKVVSGVSEKLGEVFHQGFPKVKVKVKVLVKYLFIIQTDFGV